MPEVYYVKDEEKYEGQYVAKEDYTTSDVVSFGENAAAVYKEATDKGMANPVIFYICKKGSTHIYYAD